MNFKEICCEDVIWCRVPSSVRLLRCWKRKFGLHSTECANQLNVCQVLKLVYWFDWSPIFEERIMCLLQKWRRSFALGKEILLFTELEAGLSGREVMWMDSHCPYIYNLIKRTVPANVCFIRCVICWIIQF